MGKTQTLIFLVNLIDSLYTFPLHAIDNEPFFGVGCIPSVKLMLNTVFVCIIAWSTEVIVNTLSTAPQCASHILLPTPCALHIAVLGACVCRQTRLIYT